MIVASDCQPAAAWLNPSGERSPPLSAFEGGPAKSIRAVDQGLFPAGKRVTRLRAHRSGKAAIIFFSEGNNTALRSAEVVYQHQVGFVSICPFPGDPAAVTSDRKTAISC